jgi:predicted phage terminase large subunit-like protein
MPRDMDTLDPLLRNHLQFFIRKTFETVNQGREFLANWHIQGIAWHLTQCYQGNIKRLIVTLPPRSLKSLCVSIAFPAWVLGCDPTRRIICASYADELASVFSRQTREVMATPWYHRVFPGMRFSKRKNTEREIVSTNGGYRFATSVDGTMTGRGANFIIIDDPIKTNSAMSEAERNRVNDWFKNTVFNRLDRKTEDVIIIVMQRIHVDDLVGHVLELGDWTVLNLPSIAPEAASIQIGDDEFYHRKEREVLHPEHEGQEGYGEAKRMLGSFAFEAQYQQSPLPPEGNMIKAGWFKRYAEDLPREVFSQTVQSWDTATETGEAASYSVCTTWGIRENRYYLLNVLRERLEFPTLKRRVFRHARTWGANTILIEKAASGLALLQELVNETDLPVLAITPQFDKETRVAQVSAKIEAGRVHLPTEASWLVEFEKEVLAFPNGKFDDQVDSLSQFLRWLDYGQPPELEIRVTTFPGTTTYYDRMGGSFP